MASRTASLIAAWLLLFPLLTAALQVTPDSPCSAFCLDDPDLDASDPESSNTFPEDIACHDEDFASRPEGQKFQRCLTCLQDSDYSKGHETDQQWFFYNLRYAFDYCVLGYPNATDIESSPCVTSEACGGRVEDALKDGILEPAHAEPYGYCAVSDGVMMSSTSVDNCLSCVRAGNSQRYIANFLTAVQAGCEQQPTDGITVGLSDTVFTPDPINIVAPVSASGSSGDGGTSLSTPVIVGIAIGAAVVALLAAGCIYMQVRKRRNRAARAAKRGSPLSFRCQTHLTPMTATFPPEEVKEKSYVDPAAALSSNPVGDENKWHSPDSIRPAATGLHSITTSVPKPAPAVTTGGYTSSPKIYSPDDHYYQTPTSTTSNAPLLASFRPYNPADYSPNAHIGQPPPPLFPIPGIAVSTPEETSAPQFTQTSPASPRAEQRPWQTSPSQQFGWSPQDLTPGGSRDLTRGKKRVVSGSPVSSTTIQVSFPPPPGRKSPR